MGFRQEKSTWRQDRQQGQEIGLFNTRQWAALETIWHAKLALCKWTRRTGATCSRDRRDSCWTPWKFSRLCAQRCHTFITDKLSTFMWLDVGMAVTNERQPAVSTQTRVRRVSSAHGSAAYLSGHLLFSHDIARANRIATPRVLLRQRRWRRRLLLIQHHHIRLGRPPFPVSTPTSTLRTMYSADNHQVHLAPRFPDS